MSIPVEMQFRDFLRYIVSGLLAFFLYYPYLRQLIYWSTANPSEELTISIVFILIAGIATDIVATAYSGMLSHAHQPIDHFKALWNRWRPKKPAKEGRRSQTNERKPTKFSIIIKATKEEREILRNEASAGYMAGGCALVLISFIELTLMNLASIIYQQNLPITLIWPPNPLDVVVLSGLAIAFLAIGSIYQKKYVRDISGICFLIILPLLPATIRNLFSASLEGQPLVPQLWPPDPLLFIFLLLALAAFILVGRIHYHNYRGYYRELEKKYPDSA